MTKLLMISLCFPRFMKLKVTVFSRLHKWGIANDPAVVAERFTEACFVERFGRRRQSRPKQIFMILAYLSSRSAISVAKNLCNLWLYLLILAYLSSRSVKISVNPWLINDLQSTKVYVRKNNLFMQNKANFQKVKLNVNKVLTRGYVQMDTWSIGKTKPIQSQLKPKQSQFKPKQTQFQRQKNGQKNAL